MSMLLVRGVERPMNVRSGIVKDPMGSWSCAARCQPRYGKAWNCGSAVSVALLSEDDHRSKLAKAEFTGIDVEVTRVYDVEDAAAHLTGQGIDVGTVAKEVGGKIVSAFVRATKPTSCCAPSCCSH